MKKKSVDWKYSLSMFLFKVCLALFLLSFAVTDDWSTTFRLALVMLFVPALGLYTLYYDEESRKCK